MKKRREEDAAARVNPVEEEAAKRSGREIESRQKVARHCISRSVSTKAINLLQHVATMKMQRMIMCTIISG